MAGWILKSDRQIELIREAGRIVAECLKLAGDMCVPGITTRAIDQAVERHILKRAGRPAFKGYCMSGKAPFPASICASANDIVVHGIPNDEPLREGDILSVDVGVLREGVYGDAAWTFPVGRVPPEARRLLDAGEEALKAGVAAVRPGGFLHEISEAIQSTAESLGYSVVREFVGHGIGLNLHEEPQVPNYVSIQDRLPGRRFTLKPGLVLAIEPMLNAGGGEVASRPSEWPVRTKDGSLSVHFEHTVAVLKDRAEIMSLP
ncbi:MAG: type I methionyl aminopeptidase [Planctomycetota bacterium]|nr:type I methionyl aminopeptidase [Planctomycetota bacterium]